ncbi:MAG TPA: hypothetical protein VIA06_09785 [Candidatus Dormibacteraeota bacterium]|nr:hypothetical protein [Candidatus Dormibacteraeota bacterium]
MFVDIGAASAPVDWAIDQLERAVSDGGCRCEVVRGHELPEEGADLVVTATGARIGRALLLRAGERAPEGAEAFAIFSSGEGAGRTTVAIGDGPGGVVQAILELTERIPGPDGSEPLLPENPVRGAPANAVRSIARAFVSESADKVWFWDQGFWQGYLDRLTRARFNRFHLALGMGYDFFYQSEVADTYFLFPYPFLLDLPGYEVRAEGLPAEERNGNLEMLRWVSDAATRRGLHFQLGLWTHGYEWVEAPGINYPIRGLSPEIHARYCREAIAALLAACPSIAGVTLRVHGESGISEAAGDFWSEVFAGIAESGRAVEIDLHTKGLDHPVVDAALATGMPVTLSPKYAAEHLGLPYHLTAIRPHERRPQEGAGRPGTSGMAVGLRDVMRLSAGLRTFTRYSYGDFLTRDRRYRVVYRIWPGTQRLLLWGDPAFAASLSRSGGFCGSSGLDICEPLFFAGRRDSPGEEVRSGEEGGHHAYTYEVLGRHLFAPDAPAGQSGLVAVAGDAAPWLRRALAPASRVLPLITMAHCPSAANNSYWPEMYTNMPIVAGAAPHPYRDTAPPRSFGSASALDPEMFSSAQAFAGELLEQEPSGRYTPLQVAGWLDQLGAGALAPLMEVAGSSSPGVAAIAADVRLQAGLARFFAEKLRAAVLFELGGRLRDGEVIAEAVQRYRSARKAWAQLADGARASHPQGDLAFGPSAHLRGHWADRIDAIDQDLRAMETLASASGSTESGRAWLARAEAVGLEPPPPSAVRVTESPSSGGGLAVFARVTTAGPYGPARRVVLNVRPVNQATGYSRLQMRPDLGGFAVSVNGDALDERYDTQYFLTVESVEGRRWIYPGIGQALLDQPYRTVRPRPGREAG